MGLRETELKENVESYILLSNSHCIRRLTIRNLKSRRLRWAEHVARMEQSRNAYRDFVGKSEEKETFREAET